MRLKKPEGNAHKEGAVVLLVANEDLANLNSDFQKQPTGALYALEPRGIGEARWTTKNPPNFVERSHYLLGRTVDSGRVHDVIAAARYLKTQLPDREVFVAGEGRAGVLAIYSAILEPEIAGVMLGPIPHALMEPSAPTLLNALRVCDIPEAIGMIAPRKVHSVTPLPKRTEEIFQAAGASQSLLRP